jgi:hypothetical protein
LGGGTPLAHLAQAYIHLRPYSAPETKIRSLDHYAERIAKEAAEDVYGGGVTVHIELEEGSLRARMTVVGTILFGVYGGVANYKGFKDSVVELCQDAREFAVVVLAPFTKKAGVVPSEIYRFERRLKTPGKLYRIVKTIEKLERSVDELSPKDVRKELARLRGELDSVAEDLTQSELQEVEKRLRTKKLPPPSRWPAAEVPKAAVHKSESEEEFPFDDEHKSSDSPPPTRRVVFRAIIDVPVKRKRVKKPASRDRGDFLSEEPS